MDVEKFVEEWLKKNMVAGGADVQLIGRKGVYKIVVAALAQDRKNRREGMCDGCCEMMPTLDYCDGCLDKLIQEKVAQDREERENKSPMLKWVREQKEKNKSPDSLSAMLERLALFDNQWWYWDDDLPGLCCTPVETKTRTPLAAAQAALEEVKE